MFTTTTANLAAQRQTSMFDQGPEEFELTAQAPALKLDRDGWIGHHGGGLPGRNGHWTNPTMPGVVVAHCGHQTALRPYYIEGVPQAEPRKYSNLHAAKVAATVAYTTGKEATHA